VFIYEGCGGGVDVGKRENCGPLEGCSGLSTTGQVCAGVRDVGAVVVFLVVVVVVPRVVVVEVELVEDGLLSLQ
jgi:hypothetical protein